MGNQKSSQNMKPKKRNRSERSTTKYSSKSFSSYYMNIKEKALYVVKKKKNQIISFVKLNNYQHGHSLFSNNQKFL